MDKIEIMREIMKEHSAMDAAREIAAYCKSTDCTSCAFRKTNGDCVLCEALPCDWDLRGEGGENGC